jgi:hypothetical protein
MMNSSARFWFETEFDTTHSGKGITPKYRRIAFLVTITANLSDHDQQIGPRIVRAGA